MNATTTASDIKSAFASRPAATSPKLLSHAAKHAGRIEFDSSAMDTLMARTEEIQALASCASCLTGGVMHNEKFGGFLLIDSALPLLSEVIGRLAQETADAGNKLWQQYSEAAAAANGKELRA